MVEHVDAFKTFIETQILSSQFILLIVVLNLAGLVLHKWRKFNNEYIPTLKFVAGAIIYPFIADPSKIYFASNNPTFSNVIIGFGIGGFAVILHPLLVRILAKVEKIGRKYLNGDLDKELEDKTPQLDKREQEQKGQ